MNFTATIAIHQDEDWYVAKCVENNVASQGRTIDDALANIKEALELYFEDNDELPVMKRQFITTDYGDCCVMGAKYPLLKPSAVVKGLMRHGFVFKSQKGSHAKYVKLGSPTKTAIVPMHDEIARGTLKSILEQAGLRLEELLEELH